MTNPFDHSVFSKTLLDSSGRQSVHNGMSPVTPLTGKLPDLEDQEEDEREREIMRLTQQMEFDICKDFVAFELSDFFRHVIRRRK